MTYDLFEIRGLSSTDRLILGYRRGFETFYAKPKAIAATLHFGLKTVEGSITKLRKMGLWGDSGTRNVRSNEPERLGGSPKKSGDAPEISGGTPEKLGDTSEILGDKDSVSPLKSCVLLDNTSDNQLEKNKMTGLDGSVEKDLKNLREENSVPIETREGNRDKDTGSEASTKNGSDEAAPMVPLRPDGTPMTMSEIVRAAPSPDGIADEFKALFSGSVHPTAV